MFADKKAKIEAWRQTVFEDFDQARARLTEEQMVEGVRFLITLAGTAERYDDSPIIQWLGTMAKFGIASLLLERMK